jgi:hypothetical protein
MYKVWIFLHIFGAIAFFYSHGTAGLVAFRLRSERDLGRIRAMLDSYATSRMVGLQYGALLLLLVAGIIAGFSGHWWGSGWIWLSLILLVGIIAAMYMIGTRYYGQVRKLIGVENMESGKPQPAQEPASAEEIDRFLQRSPAVLLFAIGYGGMAVILFLMIFKPF